MLRRAVAATSLAAAALAAAGCGTGGLAPKGDANHGKVLFQQKCGFCHTLADAGSTGTIGPNLDNAFAGLRVSAKDQHFAEETIREVVADQIRVPGQFNPPNAMPANLVRGHDLADVATYVSSVAGAHGYAAAGATGASTTSGTATGGGASAARGQQLYASLGCQGCHSTSGAKGTGPTFKGLAGSKVKLTNGQTVTADDAYLLKSIQDPDAEIVQGYAKGVMSAVIKPGQISKADADALIAFIKTLK